MTILEISSKYDISILEIKNRIKYLGIRGLFRGEKREFTEEEIQLILKYDLKNHYTKQTTLKYNKIKLKIFEFYLKWNNASKVARFLNVTPKFVSIVLKEFRESDCLVVESKMNSL